MEQNQCTHAGSQLINFVYY